MFRSFRAHRHPGASILPSSATSSSRTPSRFLASTSSLVLAHDSLPPSSSSSFCAPIEMAGVYFSSFRHASDVSGGGSGSDGELANLSTRGNNNVVDNRELLQQIEQLKQQLSKQQQLRDDGKNNLDGILSTSVNQLIVQEINIIESNYNIILRSCKNLGDWLDRKKEIFQEIKEYANVMSRAIAHVFSSEFALLIKLQEAKKLIINADNSEIHAELEKSLRATPLPSVLLDYHLAKSITTLNHWMAESRIKNHADVALSAEVDPNSEPSTTSQIKTLQFLRRLFPGHFVLKLESYCKKQFMLQVSNDTIQTLRPGHAHRFSLRGNYGLRSRDPTMTELAKILKRFSNNTSQVNAKEACPLIGLVSMPRQGKTSFLDFIGDSPDILQAFKTSVGNTFVLYVTFNASWSFQNTATDLSAAMEAAKYEICLRLLAAAVGIYAKSQWNDDDEGAKEKSILDLLTVMKEPEKVIALIKKQIIATTGVKNPKIIVLMDEFSNLEPSNPSSLVADLCRKALYSMMSECIGPDQAVILSGFTAIPDLQTISGRKVISLRLLPLTTTELRRQALPMHSEFFRLVSSQLPLSTNLSTTGIFARLCKHSMAVFEVGKASPGILGAVLESVRDQKTAESAVMEIPFIGTRLLGVRSGNYRSTMLTILQWKSVVAAFEDLSKDDLSSPAAFGAFVRSPDVAYVAQVPGAEKVHPALQEALSLSRVEPLFLAATSNTGKELSEFEKFLIQLTGYTIAVLFDPTTTTATSASFASTNDVRKNLCLNRFLSSNTSPITTEKNLNVTFRGILGMFYEDAVARGILFQTECRRAFLKDNRKNTDHCLSFPLSQLLPSNETDSGRGPNGVKQIISIVKSETLNVGELKLQWSIPLDAESSCIIDRFKSPGPSKISYFKGSYPHGNPREGAFFAIAPSLDTLHMPERPESNELIDIVFHVPYVADDGSIRYVEFWIDAKKSDDLPYGKKKKKKSSYPEEHILKSCLEDNTNLGSASSLVDHVVHLVITSFNGPLSDMPDYLKVPERSLKLLGKRLKSYSLYYVPPDSLAFENLVSQPIKEMMPLRDEQEVETWTMKLPSDAKDGLTACEQWKFYRAAKRNITMHLSSAAEFTEWRNVCFDEDCSLLLDQLDPSLSPMLQSSFVTSSSEKPPPDLRKFPFGCVVEALEVRPFSYSTLRQNYHDNFRVAYDHKNENQWVFTDEENDSVVKFGSPFDQNLRRQIKVGHLLHHEKKFWDSLFPQPKTTESLSEEDLEKKKRAAGELWSCSLFDVVQKPNRNLLQVIGVYVKSIVEPELKEKYLKFFPVVERDEK